MTDREPVFEAIVLAAGAGARFGGRKLLAGFDEHTVLAAAVEAALAAPTRRVRVVVGCEADAVAAEARRAAAGAGALERLAVVQAPRWADGLSASLTAGVAALPPDTDGVFVFLGDMPRVPHSAASMLAAAVAGGTLAACPVHKGKKGHPTLIARALFPQVMTLSGDQGARRVLDGLGERLALVETDDAGILLDVDTPEDLAVLQPL